MTLVTYWSEFWPAFPLTLMMQLVPLAQLPYCHYSPPPYLKINNVWIPRLFKLLCSLALGRGFLQHQNQMQWDMTGSVIPSFMQTIMLVFLMNLSMVVWFCPVGLYSWLYFNIICTFQFNLAINDFQEVLQETKKVMDNNRLPSRDNPLCIEISLKTNEVLCYVNLFWNILCFLIKLASLRCIQM